MRRSINLRSFITPDPVAAGSTHPTLRDNEGRPRGRKEPNSTTCFFQLRCLNRSPSESSGRCVRSNACQHGVHTEVAR